MEWLNCFLEKFKSEPEIEYLNSTEVYKGTIHKVRTLKFGDFQTPHSLLYAFKQ